MLAGLQQSDPPPKLPGAAVLAGQADVLFKQMLESFKPATSLASPASLTLVLISALSTIALQRPSAMARTALGLVSLANEVSLVYIGCFLGSKLCQMSHRVSCSPYYFLSSMCCGCAGVGYQPITCYAPLTQRPVALVQYTPYIQLPDVRIPGVGLQVLQAQGREVLESSDSVQAGLRFSLLVVRHPYDSEATV